MQLVIKLVENEYHYLCDSSFLPNRLKALLSPIERRDNCYLMNVAAEQADEIRDLCGEQLQIVGFDDRYQLTAEGKILETLVDKFLVK